MRRPSKRSTTTVTKPVQASGFYAVLDRDDEALARALVGAGGARILQVRLKPAAVDDIVRVARMARRVCNEAGAALVINDRIDVALAVGADGVHLGQTDLPLTEARTLAGARLALGISTHDLDQVERAVAHAPAYIAYGPIFATTTKANPDPVQGTRALRAAVRAARGIPVVAIGGITPARAGEIYAAGASAICAISAVNAASDVGAAGRAFARRRIWPSEGHYVAMRSSPVQSRAIASRAMSRRTTTSSPASRRRPRATSRRPS